MTEGVYHPYRMADVRLASERKLFTVASNFAGGGASSLGYRLAGGDVVLANELAPAAVRTYRANFPDTVLDPRDFRTIANTSDSIDAFLAQARLRRGELDVHDGSAPCKPYSTLGPGVSVDDGDRPASGVGHRDSAYLLYGFCEFARHVGSKIVIGENVPALASRHRGLFANALDALRFDGANNERRYYVNSAVLCAADFGVPQMRRRLIFIGVRKDVAEAVGIWSEDQLVRLFPLRTSGHVTIRSALEGLQLSGRERNPWFRAVMTSRSLRRLISLMPPEPHRTTSLRMLGYPAHTWFSLYRASWDRPSPTLTSLGQQPNGLAGIIHPAENRKFVVRELMRLFGLPDDMLLLGNLNQVAEMIGNMVPPFLISAVARSLHESVLAPYAAGRHD